MVSVNHYIQIMKVIDREGPVGVNQIVKATKTKDGPSIKYALNNMRKAGLIESKFDHHHKQRLIQHPTYLAIEIIRYMHVLKKFKSKESELYAKIGLDIMSQQGIKMNSIPAEIIKELFIRQYAKSVFG